MNGYNNHIDDYDDDESIGFQNVIIMIVVLLSAVTLVAVSWYAYNRYSISDELQNPPLISAIEEPTKIIPEDKDGMFVPNMDKSLYEQFLENRNNIVEVEKIVPSYEEPSEKAQIIKDMKPSINDNVAINKNISVDEISNKIDEEDAVINDSFDDLIAQNVNNEHVNNEHIDSNKNIVKNNIEVAGPKITSKSNKKFKQSDYTNSLKKKPESKGYMIQIASFKSEKDALKEWNNAKRKFGSILTSNTPYIEKTTLKDKGLFYRLQTGPFKSEIEARSVCKKLHNKKQGCLIIKPSKILPSLSAQ